MGNMMDNMTKEERSEMYDELAKRREDKSIPSHNYEHIFLDELSVRQLTLVKELVLKLDKGAPTYTIDSWIKYKNK